MRIAGPGLRIEHQSDDCGTYLLGLSISRELVLKVGKKGVFRIAPGYAYYAGSARRALKARVARHQKKRKPRHWHIDYLTARKEVKIEDVWILPGTRTRECDLAKRLLALPGAEVPVPGFGSSDCRSGCAAHLVWFQDRPDILEKTLPGA
jgi:Uri superfamily endonuclease